MSKCNEKLSPLMRMIGSSAHDPNTFIETQILMPKSRSGPAIHLTVRISLARILWMAASNQSFKAVNLGEERADATIRLLHCHDGKPTWTKPAGRVAI